MLSQTIVYIVQGSTGAYEDYTEWVAKAFFSEAKAKAFMQECINYADKAMDQVPDENGELFSLCYDYEYTANSQDPHMQCDYTGTDYCIEPIIIEGD